MDASLDDFRMWARMIQTAPGDPGLRETQSTFLEKALAKLEAGERDAGIAAELLAWALMQENHRTQYPSMVTAFRHAADRLMPEAT